MAIVGALALLTACDDVGGSDEARMKWIEARIILPPGASPMESYTRHYTWEDEGRRTVLAVFNNGGTGGRHWLARDKMMYIADGGCGVITFRFDLASERSKKVHCNGVA